MAVANGFEPRVIVNTDDFNEYVTSGSCMKISHVRIWKKTHEITVVCEL